MNIEKLPSGNYRITQMVDGKRYRTTVDHKPTKREAEELIREMMQKSGTLAARDMSFKEAAEGYCSLKSNVLSPSTLVAYDSITRNLSPVFLSTAINSMDRVIIQREINRIAESHSSKTVYNINSFIASVLDLYRPGLAYKITLPERQPIEYITPTEQMVRAVLDASAGTEYHVPFSLAVLSLRRSEACALELSDLSGNVLHIQRAKVEMLINGKRRWTVKDYPKTSDSNRNIFLPDDLISEVMAKGYFFKYTPKAILGKLNRIQDELGLPHFRFHDFRHYYASYAHKMGIPDKYIQKQGGWSTDHVMKRVYSHAFEDEYKNISEEMARTILPQEKRKE